VVAGLPDRIWLSPILEHDLLDLSRDLVFALRQISPLNKSTRQNAVREAAPRLIRLGEPCSASS
jgi:hypothetical protein